MEPGALGHYRLIRKLGSGGMGEVYLAEDTKLDREVAVKVLPVELAEDTARRRRFLTEAKAASALNHPNVCTIHEVGETSEGLPYIVMEFVRGQTLSDRARAGSIETRRIIEIGVQIADALDAAHSKRVVHRDIKPGNICLNERGEVKVLDFGLAKRMDESEPGGEGEVTRAETRSGELLGTPNYMSPEQALGKGIDHRSDIFSLGIVLYELTTGRTPFAGASFGETLDRIVNAQQEVMARFRYDVPEEYERIIRKSLQKDANLRYQSARELVIDLRNLLKEVFDGAASVVGLAKAKGQGPSAGEADAGGFGLDSLVPRPEQNVRDSDIFLSYAGVDNQPLMAGQKGWVSQFFRNLELRMAQLSGEAVRIYPHSNPLGDGKPDERVISDVPRVRALISVLSPPFLKSGGCRREIEEFWHAAERSGTLRVDNKSRIFKVVKTPVDDGEVPRHLSGLFQRLLSFDFFELDPESGRLKEFSEAFGEEARRRFLEKIYDLAFEVNQVLKRYDPAKPGGAPEFRAQGAGKVVYLGETTSDLNEERNRMKRELQERGFLVLPELPLPSLGVELEAQVRECIRRSDAVILLVGRRYGMVPEGTRESVLEIQARLSGEMNEQKARPRFFWVPPGLEPEDERQASFLGWMEREGASVAGTELLEGPIEQLKSLVIKQITAPPPEPVVDPASETDGPRRIYLICDGQDEQSIEEIEDHLFDLGFEVKVPAFDGDQEAFLQVHQENLKLCDAVLIYYGRASAQWVEIKLMDLLKAPGYGRSKPWLAKAVYVAPPEHRRKERFRSHDIEVIRETGGFGPKLLEGFVRRIHETER